MLQVGVCMIVTLLVPYLLEMINEHLQAGTVAVELWSCGALECDQMRGERRVAGGLGRS